VWRELNAFAKKQQSCAWLLRIRGKETPCRRIKVGLLAQDGYSQYR
jgi:hypothetical protein